MSSQANNTLETLDRQAESKLGTVYITPFTGTTVIHTGTVECDRVLALNPLREASDAEVQALRSIPEFAAHLDRMRGR